MTKTRFVTGAFLAVLCAGIVFAEVSAPIYRQLRGTQISPDTEHSAAATVQSSSWATPENPHLTRGNNKIAVWGKFSDTDESGVGETAGVTVGLYLQDSNGDYQFLGIAAVGTLTGSFVELDGTSAPAVAPLLVDTSAANVYDVRLRSAPSSGTVTLIHYPYGGSDRDGE